MTTNLPTLIEKLEQAEEGSRELSDEVLLTLGWKPHEVEANGVQGQIWFNAEGYRDLADLGGRPDPTCSLDDCLRYVVPGGWHLGLDPIFYEDEQVHDPVEYDAILCRPDWSRWTPVDSDWIKRIEAHGKTPELAASAAALKARAEG